MKLLTYKEVAQELGVCERTVWTLVKEGMIKARKIGRLVRIPESAIEDFIKSAPTVSKV